MKIKVNYIFIKKISISILLVVSILFFIFALLSGAEEYEKGIVGIINNSPSTIPWLVMLLGTLFAHKKPTIGGPIITILGIISVFFFNAIESIFVLFVISIPLIILGILLTYAGIQLENPTKDYL